EKHSKQIKIISEKLSEYKKKCENETAELKQHEEEQLAEHTKKVLKLQEIIAEQNARYGELQDRHQTLINKLNQLENEREILLASKDNENQKIKILNDNLRALESKHMQSKEQLQSKQEEI